MVNLFVRILKTQFKDYHSFSGNARVLVFVKKYK